MKKIQTLVDQIEDELCSAKDYAETYLELKARGAAGWAGKYKGMAEDELKHAGTIHDRAVDEVTTLEKVYAPPEDMLQKWEKSHKKYVEKAAWVKQMLQM